MAPRVASRLAIALGFAAAAHCSEVRGSLRGAAPGKDQDPFLWLEDTGSARVSQWVRQQNDRTFAALGGVDPAETPIYREVLESLESPEKIPSVEVHGEMLYNVWRDGEHVRGLWRRTTWEGYASNDTQWETVMDLDALSEADGTPWVWKGCSFLDRGTGAHPELCLMSLSRGGGDAVIVREFNITSKAFVEAPRGFVLPLAKTDVSYEDEDTLLVGSDFGPGSMTTSGYARVIRRWRRGTPVADAEVVFEVEEGDLVAGAWRDYNRRGFVYDWRAAHTGFFERIYQVRIVEPAASSSVEYRTLPLPRKCSVYAFADQLLVQLKEDFDQAVGPALPSGSVVTAPMAALLKEGPVEWTKLFEPTANRSLHTIVRTRDAVVLQMLDAVKPGLLVYVYSGDGAWASVEGDEAPELATVSVSAVDSLRSNKVWLRKESMLQPPTLYATEVGSGPMELEEMKTTAERFDPTGLEVSQRWVRSKDGTLVPYFLVSHVGDPRPRPTILYGYGGFAISMRPRYSSTVGIAWLTKGGAYALANIRGGGEFGPEWHQAAVREGRHLAYEDFAAVAEDLVASGVTTAAQLGASGGSNGGLLVGNMLVQYPDHFGAIDCEVPLLDMKRYTQLLAGASWMAEYGDPSNASDWAFLQHYSPYHNIDPTVQYPPILFGTSSADDRVHPGHARKMAARLQAESPASAEHTLLFEATEGGHASPTLRQYAFEMAVRYAFFGRFLGLDVQSSP